MTSMAMDIHGRNHPPPRSVGVPDGFQYRNKEMQILKRELQMLCDEEKEMAREKTARQQLVIRVLGASTKIIDKWDELAFMRDVIIAGKDEEVDDARKLLKETKDKQKQLEGEKKDNLNEIARLEKNLADLRANNKSREGKSKDLKKEFQDVKASNKRLNNAVKAASEGNAILKTTLEKVEGTFNESKDENEPKTE